MERRDLLRTIAAVGVTSSPLLTGLANAQPQSQSQRRVVMSNANEAVVRYLAAWNEPDAKRRRELVAKAWTDDGTYIDSAREGRGHDSLDAMIATAQGHFPGYRLNLASGIETHHDYLRFSWVAGGTAEAPLYIKGTDFVVVAGDGRIKSVVGFVDAAPARA
jgi:SnoaL-like domain